MIGSPVLTLVQQMCARTGLPMPLTLENASDPSANQYLGLLNEELEEVLLRYDWNERLIQCQFTTNGVSDQGTLSSIAGFPVNYILNDVMWDTSTRLPVFGPVSPQRWQQYLALPITGTLLQYRIREDNLLLYPDDTIPSDHLIIFEASSSYGVVSKVNPLAPAYKQFFTLNTDQCVLPDALMIASLRWRYKREKKLVYAEDKERYENILADLMTRNKTASSLRMDGDYLNNFGPGILVPSGSWQLSGGGNGSI